MIKKLALFALCTALMMGQTHAQNVTQQTKSYAPQFTDIPQSSLQKWKLIDSSSGNEFKLYFDKSSVVPVEFEDGSHFYEAWFKNEILHDVNPDDGLTVGDYMFNLWRFDCQNYQLIGIKSMRYNKQGEFLNTIYNPMRRMRDITPDTAGQLMWSHVCTKQPEK